jgi:hypothetical protein
MRIDQPLRCIGLLDGAGAVLGDIDRQVVTLVRI